MPGDAVVVVQVPAMLGMLLRYFRADRFERQAALGGLDRLLVFDGEQCVALFPPGTWQAAWRGDLEWEPPGDRRREDGR